MIVVVTLLAVAAAPVDLVACAEQHIATSSSEGRAALLRDLALLVDETDPPRAQALRAQVMALLAQPLTLTRSADTFSDLSHLANTARHAKAQAQPHVAASAAKLMAESARKKTDALTIARWRAFEASAHALGGDVTRARTALALAEASAPQITEANWRAMAWQEIAVAWLDSGDDDAGRLAMHKAFADLTPLQYGPFARQLAFYGHTRASLALALEAPSPTQALPEALGGVAHMGDFDAALVALAPFVDDQPVFVVHEAIRLAGGTRAEVPWSHRALPAPRARQQMLDLLERAAVAAGATLDGTDLMDPIIVLATHGRPAHAEAMLGRVSADRGRNEAGAAVAYGYARAGDASKARPLALAALAQQGLSVNQSRWHATDALALIGDVEKARQHGAVSERAELFAAAVAPARFGERFGAAMPRHRARFLLDAIELGGPLRDAAATVCTTRRPVAPGKDASLDDIPAPELSTRPALMPSQDR